MNLTEYQAKARATAIYLAVEKSQIIYPALGLVGECGEIAEKVKKLIRDSNNTMTDERAAAIIKELGDCCWYLANICCDTNLDLEMIYDMRGASTQQRVRQLDYYQLVLYINRHATGIATTLERLYYDANGDLAFMSEYTEVPQHMSHVIACIEEFARRLDVTLEDVYVANIENLTGREKRDTLHGDGDNR